MVNLFDLKIATGQAINILSNNGKINLNNPTEDNVKSVENFTAFVIACQSNNVKLISQDVSITTHNAPIVNM